MNRERMSSLECAMTKIRAYNLYVHNVLKYLKHIYMHDIITSTGIFCSQITGWLKGKTTFIL